MPGIIVLTSDKNSFDLLFETSSLLQELKFTICLKNKGLIIKVVQVKLSLLRYLIAVNPESGTVTVSFKGGSIKFFFIRPFLFICLTVSRRIEFPDKNKKKTLSTNYNKTIHTDYLHYYRFQFCKIQIIIKQSCATSQIDLFVTFLKRVIRPF